MPEPKIVVESVSKEQKVAPKRGGYKGVIGACEELARTLSSPAKARATVDGNVCLISRLEGAMGVLRWLDSGKNVTGRNFCEVIGV